MLKRFFKVIESASAFWSGFAKSKKKREFLQKNSGPATSQFIFILLVLLSCFVVYSAMKPAVKGICRLALQSDTAELEGMRERIIGVEARKVTLGTTQREVKSIGTLKANREVVIKSEINAKIQEILFTEGAEVTKGEELIKFEDDYFRSEKEKYEAEYKLRKGEFERSEKLFHQKVGSQKTYDEALAQMHAAKAQLESARYQLSKTTIRAPFDGIIGILKGSVSPGNIVQQHTDIVDIVDNSKVKVEFMVPAKYIEDISVGQSVEITVDAFKDRVFSGAVDAIDSEVDPKNHSILVRGVIPNQSGTLKHGMFANVKLITGEKSDVVMVDEDALDREGSIEFVWVIDEKRRAYRKRVLTGAKDSSGVEIVAGLKEGEIVVVTGQLKLTDGSKTKILNESDFSDETEKNTDEQKEIDQTSDEIEKDPGKEEAKKNEDAEESKEDTTDLKESKKGSDVKSSDDKGEGGKDTKDDSKEKKEDIKTPLEDQDIGELDSKGFTSRNTK
jgi:membrane fusion protein (multidrug efflux system)